MNPEMHRSAGTISAKIASEAWQEAVEIAKSSEGWTEEKKNKDTVRGDNLTNLVIHDFSGRSGGES